MSRGAAPLHIGIVACSAEGAALCYRTLCAEGPALLGPHAHPEITMHTPSLAAYVRCLEAGHLNGVGALMLASAQVLAGAGAGFLICPDNTLHQALPAIRGRSPLPWLHIAEVVADEAAARGFERVGVLGTHWLLASAVYPDALAARGIACVRPSPERCERIGRIIMDELVAGVFRQASIEDLREDIADFAAVGCDAVVLGCTELPLVLHDGNSPLPTLDSTRLLARAALRRALGDADRPR